MINPGYREMASDTGAGYPLSPGAHQHLGYQPVAGEEDQPAPGDMYFRKELVANSGR